MFQYFKLETIYPKIATHFTILCVKMGGNGQYRFGLQKGVKIEFRGRIRNRDNQIVYGYICYFFEKSSFTLLKIPLIEFRVLTPF